MNGQLILVNKLKFKICLMFPGSFICYLKRKRFIYFLSIKILSVPGKLSSRIFSTFVCREYVCSSLVSLMPRVGNRRLQSRVFRRGYSASYAGFGSRCSGGRFCCCCYCAALSLYLQLCWLRQMLSNQSGQWAQVLFVLALLLSRAQLESHRDSHFHLFYATFHWQSLILQRASYLCYSMS